MTRRSLLCAAPLAAAGWALAQESYDGPKPAKKDTAYLMHGEQAGAYRGTRAAQADSKEGNVFYVPGETSTARTPLAEPIFLFDSDQITVDRLALYQFIVRNGRREIVMSGKHKKVETKTFHVSLRKLTATCIGWKPRKCWTRANTYSRRKATTPRSALRFF